MEKEKSTRKALIIGRQAGSIILLALIALIAFGASSWRASRLKERLETVAYTQQLSFEYRVHPGDGHFTLYIGDLNGLNGGGCSHVKDLAAKGTGGPSIFIPTIGSVDGTCPSIGDRVGAEDIWRAAANNRGVVLVDNFCTRDWEKVKTKERYRNGQLSAGPFCQSEPETFDLDLIIRKFPVERVVLYCDVSGYREFIGNFIAYLEQKGIPYDFTQSSKNSE